MTGKLLIGKLLIELLAGELLNRTFDACCKQGIVERKCTHTLAMVSVCTCA